MKSSFRARVFLLHRYLSFLQMPVIDQILVCVKWDLYAVKYLLSLGKINQSFIEEVEMTLCID